MDEMLYDVDEVEDQLSEYASCVVLDATDRPWLLSANEEGAFFVGVPEEIDEGADDIDPAKGFFRDSNPHPHYVRPVFPLTVLANR